jgi:hypothetical protein
MNSVRQESWLDNLIYYITTRNWSPSIYLHVDNNAVICEVCRIGRCYDGEYVNNDCGAEVEENPHLTNRVCNYYEVCQPHTKIECIPCHIDSLCMHCTTCINTHVIRVVDEILEMNPVYKNENYNPEWTTFDLCMHCKYPVCYLYAPNPGFDFRNWSYLDSSRGRVHTVVLTQDM